MLPVVVLRGSRPRSFPRLAVTSIQLTVARHGVPFSVSCFRGVIRNQLTIPAVRRSFLLTNKNRCLSTVPHTDEGNLIYTGNLSTAVRGIKFFSYSTSMASLLVMPQILLKTGIGVQSMALQVAFCGCIGIFTFITPVLLHIVTKGYVTRLYHNPDRDTYTAITYSIFLTEKKNVFHQSQVRIPAVSKMFTSFYANNFGLLVNPELFPIPQDYNHLMGYDKPFSFSMDDLDQPDKS